MSDVPPNMLTYESAMPGRISLVRQAAWISLLVVGIVTILAGLCMGGSVAMMVLTYSPLPSRLWIVGVVYPTVPVGIGITQVVCSVKIRGKSLVAAIVAAAVGGLGLLVVAGVLVAIVVIAAIGRHGADPLAIMFSVALYVAIGCVLGVVEWLMIKVIREARP